MNVLARRRRRRTLIAFVCGVLVLGSLPVSAVVAWRAVRDSKAAEAVVALPTVSIPTTPTAILATTDEQNFLASLSILAISPNGAGGTIMSLPVGLALNGQPEGEPKRLADVYGSDGPEALKVAVESLTNTQIDFIAVADESGTGDLLARVGTIDARFSADVLDMEDDQVRKVADQGPNSFTPLQAAAVLAARDPQQLESDRLPAIKALWDGVVAAVGSGKIGTQPASVIPDVGAQVPADMPAFMSALFAGPVRTWQIAYQRFEGDKANPDDVDVYGYDLGEIVMVLATVAPSAMVAVFPTITVQVDSPFPESETVRQAVYRLLYMGANVMLVRNVNSIPPEQTTILYSDEMDRGIAEPLTVLLDEIDWEKATDRVAGIDLQIILGRSFTDFLAQTSSMSMDEVLAAAQGDSAGDATGDSAPESSAP
jgi:hypothetical protein